MANLKEIQNKFPCPSLCRDGTNCLNKAVKNESCWKHQKTESYQKTMIRALFLSLFAFFLFGCGKPQDLMNAEQKALEWVSSEGEIFYEPFKTSVPLAIKDMFYVLSSSKLKDGYCVEIASHERKPAKYPGPLSPITTIPLFVSKNGEIREDHIDCFLRAYPDKRGELIKDLSRRLSQEKKVYSLPKLILIREIGNAVSKTKFKLMGYKPNYEENSAYEYFTDVLLKKYLGNEEYNNTMRAYLYSEWEINGEEMVADYVESVR